MRKNCREKLFAGLFFVSFLLNLNQCSESDDSNIDQEMLEYELSEIKSELSLVKTEMEKISNLLSQEKKVEPVEVKKTKVIKPVEVDSVVAEPVVVETIVDSIK